MKIDYELLHLGWDAFSLDFFFELLPEDHGFTDEQVERIWETSHMSIDDIRKAAGLTQAAMAKRFDIPKRTIENWCRGVSRPPEYVRFMLIDLLGLLDEDNAVSCHFCSQPRQAYQETHSCNLRFDRLGCNPVLIADYSPCPPNAVCSAQKTSKMSAFKIKYCPECGRELR